MKEFVALRSQTYSHLADKECVDKKAKGKKKCVIKQEIRFKDYKKCLKSNKTILPSQQRFKRELHNVFMEKINRIVLSGNDDERIQTFDRVIPYRYGTAPGRMC